MRTQTLQYLLGTVHTQKKGIMNFNRKKCYLKFFSGNGTPPNRSDLEKITSLSRKILTCNILRKI